MKKHFLWAIVAMLFVAISFGSCVVERGHGPKHGHGGNYGGGGYHH